VILKLLDPDSESASLMRIRIQGVNFTAHPCGSGSETPVFKGVGSNDQWCLPNGLEHEVAPGNVQVENGDVVDPLHQLTATPRKLRLCLQQQHQCFTVKLAG